MQQIDLLETDASLQPGDSGGPLLDSARRVVGMDSAASASFSFRGSNDAYAIPINRAVSLARQIVAVWHVDAGACPGSTAFLGVQAQPAERTRLGRRPRRVRRTARRPHRARPASSAGDILHRPRRTLDRLRRRPEARLCAAHCTIPVTRSRSRGATLPARRTRRRSRSRAAPRSNRKGAPRQAKAAAPLPRPRHPARDPTELYVSSCTRRALPERRARAPSAGARRRRPPRARPPRPPSRPTRAPVRASGAAPRARILRPRRATASEPAGLRRVAARYAATPPAAPATHVNSRRTGPMLHWEPLPAPSTCRSVPSCTGSRGRLRPWEGDIGTVTTYEILLLLDPEQAEYPGGARRAPARARRGLRRDVAQPRRVGQAPPHVRDRQEERGRVPPRRLRERPGNAGRDRPRAQDRRRRPAPDGDQAHRRLEHTRAPRGYTAAGGARTGGACAPTPAATSSRASSTLRPRKRTYVRTRRSRAWRTSTASCWWGT